MIATHPDERSPASRLLREVERRTQIRAGLARVVLAVVLYTVVQWAVISLPDTEVMVWRQVHAARVILIVFGVVGLAVYWLAKHGVGAHRLPYATALIDATLILGNLAFNHASTDAPGNITFVFPVIWVVPIALAGNAIYFRPGLQAFATAVYVVGIAAISCLAGYLPAELRIESFGQLGFSLGWQPNAVRLVMLLALGLLLVLAALQGRRILDRAVREATLRLNLTRYLPRELAHVLSEDAFAELRAGQRIRAALLFVDIRASSARAAGMDPTDLARFIGEFRQRVMRAAAQHRGVIDKFVGDGALVVFGVPRPAGDEAARAIACALTMAELISRWNADTGFGEPVEVGIGVHCGEVFCGVVGDEGRLEFTVLGDAVNVASRLEHATRLLGGPILASLDIVQAAGQDGEAGWREVSRDPLPGLRRPMPILAPLSGRAAGEAAGPPVPARAAPA